MKSYYVWITALLASYQDGIVAGMVRKGYMIGAANLNGQVVAVNTHNAPSTLFAFMVYKLSDQGEVNTQGIIDDISAVCVEHNYYCNSVIVSVATEAVWSGANFDLPKQEEVPVLPAPNKKMN